MDYLTGSDFMTANSQNIDSESDTPEGLSFTDRLKYYSIAKAGSYHLGRAAGYTGHRSFLSRNMFLPKDLSLSKLSRLDIGPRTLLGIGFVAFGEQPEDYWKTGALFAGVYGSRHILRSAGLINGPIRRKFKPGDRKLKKGAELSEALFDFDETLVNAGRAQKGGELEMGVLKQLRKKGVKKMTVWSAAMNYPPYFATKLPNVELSAVTGTWTEGIEYSKYGKINKLIPKQPRNWNPATEAMGQNFEWMTAFKEAKEKNTILAGSADIAGNSIEKNVGQLTASKSMPETFRRGILVDDKAEEFANMFKQKHRYITPEKMEEFIKKGKTVINKEGVFIKSGKMALERGEKIFKAVTKAKPFSRAASLIVAGSILAEVTKPAVISGINQLQNAVNNTMQRSRLDFGGTQMNIPMEAYSERNEALQRIQDARMQAGWLFGNESQRYHS